jgi:hypothetical protein
MDKAARWRWTVWVGALLATLGAIYYPAASDEVSEAIPAPKRTDKTSTVSVSSIPAVADAVNPPDPEYADPFAPRGWQAPPPPVQQQVAVVPAEPVAPPTPQGPPPLPYRFVGRLNDAGEQVVYLSHGDQALSAHVGETLEGTYKVLGIEPLSIAFEYLPTGEKQQLILTAIEN